MSYKLFLDDIRPPPDQTWVVARTAIGAVTYTKTYGAPARMSLDHDLGGIDAPVFLRALIDLHLDGMIDLSQTEMTVHSANPAGRDNLEGLWKSFQRSVLQGCI